VERRLDATAQRRTHLHWSRSSAWFAPAVAETETEHGLIRPRQTAVLLQRVFLGRHWMGIYDVAL
jgi:hypothetical protein